MKKYLTRDERQEHLERWKAGGMSKNAYALSVGICPRTFMGWTWQKPGRKDSGFVEIPKEKLVGGSQDIVIEKCGITIRIPLAVGVQELQTVFAALGGVQ